MRRWSYVTVLFGLAIVVLAIHAITLHISDRSNYFRHKEEDRQQLVSLYDATVSLEAHAHGEVASNDPYLAWKWARRSMELRKEFSERSKVFKDKYDEDPVPLEVGEKLLREALDRAK